MSITCPVRAEPSPRKGAEAPERGKRTELEPVNHHLQAALQVIRDLPIASLERERYYTFVYQLMSAALDLVVEDSIYGQPNLVEDDGPSKDLMSDLDAIKGG